MKKRLTKIPVGLLLTHREYDRIAKPAPRLPFIHKYTVADHIQYIKDGNKIEPIELVVVDNKLAVIAEGNHRTAAYNKLYGAKHEVVVEVNFVRYPKAGNLTEHATQALKPISSDLAKILDKL